MFQFHIGLLELPLEGYHLRPAVVELLPEIGVLLQQHLLAGYQQLGLVAYACELFSEVFGHPISNFYKISLFPQ